MKSTLKQILDREGILVLDGSMGTALENLGADLNNKLWTARVLADRPELVKEVHIQYFRAGADAGITCSYQASLPGLMETGYSREQAEALITRAVQVFLDARQEWWDAEGKQAGRSWPVWPVPAHTGLIWPMGPNIRAITASVPIRCGTSIAAGRNSCGRPVPTSCSLKRNRP